MEKEDGILGKPTSKGTVYVRGFQGCFGILGIGRGPRGALTGWPASPDPLADPQHHVDAQGRGTEEQSPGSYGFCT